MDFYVYILQSEMNGNYYVGMAENVEVRLGQHNGGKTRSTKAYTPWKVIHKEVYSTRIEAKSREKYLKSAAGRRWRKDNLVS